MRILAVLPLLLVAGCHSHGGTGPEPDEYTGCATDENWATFDDRNGTAVISDTAAPVLTEPTAASLPADPKPVFSWRRSAGDTGRPDGDVPYMNGPGCDNCCPQFNTGALTTLHLPPISGNAYDLQFLEGDKVVYRVLTTLQKWTPPDAVWSAWRGKSLSLRIYRMSVLRNDPKEGPFTPSAPYAFSVAP